MPVSPGGELEQGGAIAAIHKRAILHSRSRNVTSEVTMLHIPQSSHRRLQDTLVRVIVQELNVKETVCCGPIPYVSREYK